MPVQRTREEEEKLELEALQNGIAITEDAISRMKRALERIAQIENKKPENKK